MSKITTMSLGGCEEVTGSCHLLKDAYGKKYMIDCGAFQGASDAIEKNKNQKFDTDLETVIVSHCHYDHVGLLPNLIKQGYNQHQHSSPAASKSSAYGYHNTHKQSHENSSL